MVNHAMRSLFVLVLLCIMTVCYGSQSDALDNLEVDVSGRINGATHSPPQDSEYKQFEGVIRLDLIYTMDLLDYFWLKLNPRLQFDSEHTSEGGIDDITDNEDTRRSIDLREGFLEYRSRRFDYFLGKRIFSLGKADYFNPSDKINPKDYTDFLDTTKIGVFATGFEAQFGTRSSLDAYLIPFFTKSRVYLTDHRWAILPPESASLADLIQEDLPSKDGENIQAVFRYKAYLTNLDVALVYLRNIDDIPVFLARTQESISQEYRRENIFSVNASTTYGNVEFHGEIAYYNVEEEVFGAFLQYVVGINYFTQDRFFQKELEFIGEYLNGVDTQDPNDQVLVEEAFDLTRTFENSLFFRAEYSATDFSTITFTDLFLCSTTELNNVVRLEYIYNPNDQMNVKLGADMIWGENGTLLEQFEDNDRIWAEVEFFF
ncbi:hypothetical protein GF339_00910 [candidate division KSB3 bacterium]|uniref:Porin n=1 Tax=candidate division KSB3 bacterium TaxID=2044937 RepID=A0A9D5JRV4_9BACT|nr:hypothetical protein [candidate division KSB3 bacterium]MBD3323109.1 hypothetical protein [candidate division KSB3 bacterium]